MKLGYGNNHSLPRFDTLPTRIRDGARTTPRRTPSSPLNMVNDLRHAFKTRLIVIGHTFFTKITKSTHSLPKSQNPLVNGNKIFIKSKTNIFKSENHII